MMTEKEKATLYEWQEKERVKREKSNSKPEEVIMDEQQAKELVYLFDQDLGGR